MAAELIMTKGLPASGKSFWAEAEVLAAPAGAMVRINKDLLRIMLHAGRWKGKKTENQIVAARDSMIESFLTIGVTVIVDDTNFAPFHEERLRELAVKHDAVFTVKDFTDVPLDVCLERDWKRTNSVGPQVIHKMWNKYLAPAQPSEVEGLLSAIVVDLDGTLALMDGRSPYDYTKVGEDLLDNAVALLVRDARIRGDAVLVVSGRDDSCWEETALWLKKHDVPYDALLMRSTGDKRPDREAKRDIYREHIEGKYNVRYVVDDRDSVVAMWRSLGLKTLQVAYGNF